MTPLEYLYYLGYTLKKRYALKNRKRLPCQVVSIGNITLGGTGKTPAAMALVKKAAAEGYYPCILTRGYKGKAEGPCFVSRGEGPLLDAAEAGDEAVLMAETLPGVPIVKARNRYDAGIYVLEKLQSSVFSLRSRFLLILDDGFQHWRLHRDIDILLIDGTNPFGNKRLLPLGSLREPVSAINRADIVVITKTDKIRSDDPEFPNSNPTSSSGEGVSAQESGIKGLIAEIRQYNPEAPIFSAEHRPSLFVMANKNTFPLAWAKNKKVFAFCGIGNPDYFKNMLLSLVGELRGFIVFRDHYQYTTSDIRRIAENSARNGADWIVTTEKDIMRLKQFPLPGNLLALRIEFHTDDEFYKKVFHQLQNRGNETMFSHVTGGK